MPEPWKVALQDDEDDKLSFDDVYYEWGIPFKKPEVNIFRAHNPVSLEFFQQELIDLSGCEKVLEEKLQEITDEGETDMEDDEDEDDTSTQSFVDINLEQADITRMYKQLAKGQIGASGSGLFLL
ncbi:unnamed protein product [Amoebophrya sp. A120]|nr:unnamed protein product [Amoebophrya sp. A120]|eukprot:GSA120T00021832001.1